MAGEKVWVQVKKASVTHAYLNPINSFGVVFFINFILLKPLTRRVSIHIFCFKKLVCFLQPNVSKVGFFRGRTQMKYEGM